MKSLLKLFAFGLFEMVLLINVTSAQGWSNPVALTSGPGDDHHITVCKYSNYPVTTFRIAWDRAEDGDADILTGIFDLDSGELTDIHRIPGDDATDERPSFVSDLYSDDGLVFQSDRTGLFAIYYAALTDSGWQDPTLTLHSDVDLYDPQFRVGGSCIPEPTIFFRSASSAYHFDYAMFGFSTMPRDTAFFIYVDPGNPVHSFDGFWSGFPGTGLVDLHWIWEEQVNAQHQIQYVFHFEDIFGSEWYDGVLSEEGYNLHYPVFNLSAVIYEREDGVDGDIMTTSFDSETEEWSTPSLAVPDLGWERNYNEFVYEVDYNGNWDIAFWHYQFTQPELICPAVGEDRNPVFYHDIARNRYYVFWESDRDGVWNIYYSLRTAVGIEEENPVYFPENLGISIHPNPGNSEFQIDIHQPFDGLSEVAVYDISGRLIDTIHSGWLSRGVRSLYWNAEKYPSGLYFIRCVCSDRQRIEKIAFLK